MLLDPTKGHAQTVLKVTQSLLENAGGAHLKQTALVPRGGVAAPAIARDAIDAGYDFIQRERPRTTEGLAHLRWIAKQVQNEPSPIFRWNEPT